MRPFVDDLAQAKADRLPVIALRPDGRFPEVLDDIVVKDVQMFRAEAMSDTAWWMACYFANGQRLTFNVGIDTKPKRISVSAGELPEQWVDLDTGDTR